MALNDQTELKEANHLRLSNSRGAIPLYMQIKNLLVKKVSAGEWPPGGIIPSEIRLAQELDVSQGTVRKAITELVEANVLIRRQGRGTFVTNHDDHRALFHFFHIYNDSGTKFLPECETLSCKQKRATRKESAILGIQKDAKVVRIDRIRKLDGIPTIVETIILPAEPFQNLTSLTTDALPNMLYELYETQFGITIHRAEEQLRSISAGEKDASLLGVEANTPLLEITRIALTLDGAPIELRISRCSTEQHYYRNTVF
jgi:GntR family transcriptional regulator